MDTQNVLSKLVNAARKSYDIDEKLQGLGYESTPYFYIYGNVADAIYAFVGEKTNTFDESMTYKVLMDNNLSADECADILEAQKHRTIMQSYIGQFANK